VHFDEFVLQLQPALLTKYKERVPLRSQPLRLLTLLATHPGELVTHKEIREHLWGDIHVDFASGIHVCIRQIRKALDDNGDHPKYIETIPRQGYRFLPTVTQGVALGALPRKKTRQRLIAFGGVTGLIVVAWLFMGVQRDESEVTTTSTDFSSSAEPYIRGRELLDSGNTTDQIRARAFFQETIKSDPDFAPAYANLAESYEKTGNFESARIYASQAIEKDSTYVDGYVRMAMIESRGNWNWTSAEAYLAQGLALAPEQTSVNLAYADLYIVTGRPDEAHASMRVALAQDPTSARVLTKSGYLHYLTRRTETAIQQCGAALELDPAFYLARLCSYRAALDSELLEDAMMHALALMAMQQATSQDIENVAQLAPAQGIDSFERWVQQTLTRRTQMEDVSPILFAYSVAAQDRYDEALFYLSKAGKEKRPLAPQAYLDPIFFPIRHASKYLELAAAAGVVFPEMN